jgi:phenylpropionate dioxygenase-like ring-hydroxylating dioxygenase large terminal subunit
MMSEAEVFMAMPPYDTGQFADHTTRLVRNCWYVAALSEEVTRTLSSKILLGTSVVMFRKLDGTPVIMRNRCPHRSFPLAKGKLDGDHLVCGYHGMRFDGSGRCIEMPAMPITPSNVRLASYPTVERSPLVWVWMGEPDKADESLVPDTSWLGAPDWKSVGGYYHIKSNYVAMHENLLDQTHFAFLHPNTVGTPAYARSKLNVRQEGEKVRIFRELRNSEPNTLYGVPMDLMGRKVDRYSDSSYVSPAMHVAFAKVVNPNPRDGERREFQVTITHLITPESQETLHYYWFNTRDFKLDNQSVSDYLREQSVVAYLEDVEALEWIADVVRNDQEQSFELSFAPDKPGLLMRRNINRLAMAEAGTFG